MKIEKTIKKLQEFANKHSVVLEKKGEIGFGRACVGFLHGESFISYNPTDSETFKYILGERDERICSPSGVDSYHKGNYMAVLVSADDYNEGLLQLLKWVEHIESQGEVEVVEYPTGATGLQALISGMYAKAIKLKNN